MSGSSTSPRRPLRGRREKVCALDVAHREGVNAMLNEKGRLAPRLLVYMQQRERELVVEIGEAASVLAIKLDV